VVGASVPRPLQFPDRQTVIQVSLLVERCRFDWPGVYLVELYCNNAWVCDTRLVLIEPEEGQP